MNRIITLLTLCIVAIATAAQENLAITYTVTNCDNDNCEPRSNEMTLVANSEKSLFYNKMSLYVDSCRSTPEGKARLREIQLKAWRVEHPDGTVTYDGRKLGLAPDKQIYLYVEKNASEGEMTVYDSLADGQSRYVEPMSEMEWTIIGDSTKMILSYDCVMATTDYHGRKWTIWFAPDIPVQDGPWKLHGLLGAILAADGGDGFVIEAKEVGATSQPVPEVYSKTEYEKGERRRLLADHEHYINNFESMLAAEGYKLNADGSPADLPKYDRQRRAWETDY